MQVQLTLENFNKFFANVRYDVSRIPTNDTVEEYIFNYYYHLYSKFLVVKLKKLSIPARNRFPGMPNERKATHETRKLTRPWDSCWFSNKPHIVHLTVEEAINKYPMYMRWCYKNLDIKWSTHTIKLLEQLT